MASIDSYAVRKAFATCMEMARTHYENFPVASLAIPRDRRPYVAAVYAFARTADDFADEGDLAPQERLRRLAEWGELLDAAYEGKADTPVFIAIAETARATGLPKEPLADLLKAFTMDVTTTRYATFTDLLWYCRHSANPVGRLVLHLFDDYSPEALAPSDAVCTGLQLANFWQDLSIDWARGRLYLPLDDVARFGYTTQDLQEGRRTPEFQRLMAFQVERAAGLLCEGRSLLEMVSRRLRIELDLTIRGGLVILDRIAREGYDVLHHRPRLTAIDKGRILAQAFFGSRL